MRPLRLEVKGFTAFREAQPIDFTALDVFAIAGPTGSGKSSLLDAMTYALYGRVERVGDRVSQLISQGQPRMAVTLEFQVGNERYRVTRSTPAKGATKIQLERQFDGEWVQAGDGSDRVREADRIITRTIGLTYDGFTRSVLLPQGKFAEFLVGDAKKRRDILTELLGLSLFRRIAERAGAIAKESHIRAGTMADMLEREYTETTPDALKAARAAAKEAERREKALGAVAEQVLEILGRWKDLKRSVDELRACADEATAAAVNAGAASEELASLAGRLDEAMNKVEATAAASKAAGAALDEARVALRDVDTSIGRAEDLSRALTRAHSLMEARRARDARIGERDRAMNAAQGLRHALEAAEGTTIEAAEALGARERELAAAEAALEEARHADLVAAVSSGLRAGDPCPVCGLPLEEAPRPSGAEGLTRAMGAMEESRKRLENARRAATQAERGLESARRDVDANTAEERRLAADLEELESRIVADEETLATVLGDPLPDDPGAALEERMAELRRLDRAERDAERLAADAAQALSKVEGERDRVAALIERQRDRLAADHRPLLDRAARAIGKDASPVKLSSPPSAEDPAALEAFARKLAKALSAFARRLAEEVERRSSIEGERLREAVERVGDLVDPAPTLDGIAQTLDAACRTATADVATTAQRADDLALRLERKKELAGEGKQLEDRSRLFKVLALELRADRLIAFLQAEALQVLAAAGSERLVAISDGRYRLVCRDDEFFVVDL
ncbi:MAG: SMC family ATPase, partial [Actinobacteria bacterium]|nr:SMC family ATPase [Actinomycetota bacterium]